MPEVGEDTNASTPGLSTNATTGTVIQQGKAEVEMTTYEGIGHLSMTMHLAESETDDVTIDWSYSLGLHHLKAHVKSKADKDKYVSVEINLRELLQTMALAGITAMGYDEPAADGVQE